MMSLIGVFNVFVAGLNKYGDVQADRQLKWYVYTDMKN